MAHQGSCCCKGGGDREGRIEVETAMCCAVFAGAQKHDHVPDAQDEGGLAAGVHSSLTLQRTK